MHVGTARPDRCGVTPKLCLWDGLWDWTEGLINRSCEAEVIYVISLTRPEINDSLLYMSFITLNLLLLFSSLKVYAHTHAQTHQVHETSYYVNMCNYDSDGVGRIERERQKWKDTIFGWEYCGRESHGTYFQMSKASTIYKAKGFCVHRECVIIRMRVQTSEADNPQTSQQNSSIKPHVFKRSCLCHSLQIFSRLPY